MSNGWLTHGFPGTQTITNRNVYRQTDLLLMKEASTQCRHRFTAYEKSIDSMSTWICSSQEDVYPMSTLFWRRFTVHERLYTQNWLNFCVDLQSEKCYALPLRLDFDVNLPSNWVDLQSTTPELFRPEIDVDFQSQNISRFRVDFASGRHRIWVDMVQRV